MCRELFPPEAEIHLHFVQIQKEERMTVISATSAPSQGWLIDWLIVLHQMFPRLNRPTRYSTLPANMRNQKAQIDRFRRWCENTLIDSETLGVRCEHGGCRTCWFSSRHKRSWIRADTQAHEASQLWCIIQSFSLSPIYHVCKLQ